MPAPSDTIPTEAFLIPDISTLLQDLKHDRPQLTSVHAALKTGNTDTAAQTYIAHFRTREFTSSLFTNWSSINRDPNHITTRADGYLSGHLDDGYNTYDVPQTGIDWDGNPLSCITRFPIFSALHNAYHHTQDARYLRFTIDHLLEYMDAYPIETFIGTNTVGGWINHYHVARPWYWCMIPERLVEISQTLALARSHLDITNKELLRLIHRLYQETAYLRADVKRWIDRRHNGGCAMIGSLATACALLEDFEATEEWLDFDAQLLAQYVEQAFYPDGQCIEQTSAYSISIVSQMQSLAYVLKDRPAIEAIKPRFPAMTTWIAALSKPTGNFPSFGDNYARPFKEFIDNSLLDWLDLPWARPFLNGTGHPSFTVWPEPGHEQWSGYYTMRSNWSPNARYMALDCGPWGTTHQHGDRLSFCLSAEGADFIIDPTSTRYASNEPDAFLSRQEQGYLHNTLTVDGVDEFQNSPIEIDTPLQNIWQHGDHYSHFSGNYTFAPVKPVTWQRRVLFVDQSYWLLQDILTGDLDRVQVEQNFQFEKDIDIDIKDNRTIATAPNGARLVLLNLTGGLTPQISLGDTTPRTTYWAKGEPHQTRLAEDGERPPSHGRGWTGRWGHKLLPAPAVTYVGPTELPATLTLALIPLAPHQSPNDLPDITLQTTDNQTAFHLPTSTGTLTYTTTPEKAIVSQK
ncbi:MAG: heparinase II/III family protein [bacterium]|nr:heparinase II/III family protein [bacterium]